VVRSVGLALLYGFLLLPLAVVVLASFTAGPLLTFPPQGLSLRWYAGFFGNQSFLQALGLSLRVAAMTALLASLVATPAALCHRRLAGGRRAAFRLLLLAPLLLPELLTAIGLLFLLQRLGLGHSVAGLVIGHTVIALPFAFLSVAAALEQVPEVLERAALSLGARRWTVAMRVLLPLVRPGVLTGALFAFIVSFDMFTLSLLLKPVGGDTLPLALFAYLQYDFDPTAAVAASVSVAIAFLAVAVIDRLVGLRRAF
jgi:putative spermidine/putrescine transport system permease protein